MRVLLAAMPVTDDPAVLVRLAWLEELAADVETVAARIKTLDARLEVLVAQLGSTLRDEVGIGVVCAAEILVRVGDPTGSRTRPRSHAGTAPPRSRRLREKRIGLLTGIASILEGVVA